MSVRIAEPNRPRIVPAFVVKKLEGKHKREMITFDSKGKRKVEVVEEPAGYLVSFPVKGHSIRVRNDADLKRLGFDRTIPLVDANSEDDSILGELPNEAA